MDLSNITQGTHCYQIFDIPLNNKSKNGTILKIS